MKIIIETVPHDEQRYDTVGDWQFDADGTLHVSVSIMGDLNYEFLVGVHEAIEAFLCQHRGVTDTDVTRFDKEFEENRAEDNYDEPGDDLNAPYRREHFFATTVERMISAELGVDWAEYDKKVMSL